MKKQDVELTQQIWKDYPLTQSWIDILRHPEEHGFTYVCPDGDWYKAIESVSYILTGYENDTFKEMRAHPERFPFLCAEDRTYGNFNGSNPDDSGWDGQ